MMIRNLHKMLFMSLGIILLYLPLNSFALNYYLSYVGDDLIGKIHIVQSRSGDTLYKIARRFEMGYYEMTKANPKIRKEGRIPKSTGITIPSLFVLPDAPQNGIVVNLPEMRLYYYPKDRFEIITEPISIGRLGWGTPEVSTYIVEKIKDPIWTIPESIQLHSYEKGTLLPDVMAPGPDNPLGQYALRLGVWSILIHGTNRPITIGRRISSGCIRMYPEDIEHLFQEIDKNTPVHIVNQPYKVGWHQGNLYLEVHKPLLETVGTLEEEQLIIHQLIMSKAENHYVHIDWRTVAKILHEHSGIPYRINE